MNTGCRNCKYAEAIPENNAYGTLVYNCYHEMSGETYVPHQGIDICQCYEMVRQCKTCRYVAHKGLEVICDKSKNMITPNKECNKWKIRNDNYNDTINHSARVRNNKSNMDSKNKSRVE